MKAVKNIKTIFHGVTNFRVRRILYIAIFWTLIDIINWLLLNYPFPQEIFFKLLLRSTLVFVMSMIMGYLFVYTLRSVFRNSTMMVNFIAKTFILLVAALLMNFFINLLENTIFLGFSFNQSIHIYLNETMHINWLIRKTLYWIILFVVTQLYLEINDKYSPGVFLDILKGKYTHPKTENRIVMFIDLKDSTPIAEQLGHEQYFLFIRRFIADVSMALIEYNGIIYQYVGDEIVVSWPLNDRNISKCLAAVILSRKNIQKRSEKYRRKFGIIPEFRVGIHSGEVTVGEIGVIKKDLAMSGDTMNTTARIRSACNELNEKFIVSKDFISHSVLKSWQAESLGVVELKGKSEAIELFSLKI